MGKAAAVVGIVIAVGLACFLAGRVTGPAAKPDVVKRLEPARTEPAPAPAAELDRLKADLDKARAEVVRLEGENKALRAEKVAPVPPATDAEASAAELEREFESLAEAGVMAMGSPKFQELMKAYRKLGAAGIAALAQRLQGAESAEERFLAAALFEAMGDPAAIPALAAALRSDADDLVRRMSSHALAVIGTPEARGSLREAMEGDKDWGVRVNSAYGLAKQGDESGVVKLVTAYGSGETPTEYRLAILGGMADVAHASYLPVFRKILSDSRDMAYLLMAIGGLAKAKDPAAIQDLERVATSDLPEAVKQAAKKAVKKIQE